MARAVNGGRRKRNRQQKKSTTPATGGRNYQPRMSQPERAARRKAIAEAVRAGGDWAAVEDAAERYGVSISMVRSACQAHKVPFPKPSRISEGDGA